MIRVSLSTKTDDQFFEQLCQVIQALGGAIQDSAWNLGPGTQVTTYAITLPQGQLIAQEDSEGGFFIKGNDELVSFLIRQFPINLLFHSMPINAVDI
jgi:hypothetical protein